MTDATREDIFPNYTQQVFESELDKYFTMRSCVSISNSQRTLYLMENSQL